MRSKHSHALVNMVKAKIIFNFIKPAFKGLVWSNKMHSWAQKIEFWVKMAHLYIYIKLVWTPHDGRALFLFKKWFYLLENDLESPLIFVLFLKG